MNNNLFTAIFIVLVLTVTFFISLFSYLLPNLKGMQDIRIPCFYHLLIFSVKTFM